MADPAGAPPRTLPIRLTTRHANHAIPDEPYLVPLDWRRTQLSQLVNKVLGYDRDGARTVPFDFVVDGQLLRGSLQSWLEQKGLTEVSRPWFGFFLFDGCSPSGSRDQGSSSLSIHMSSGNNLAHRIHRKSPPASICQRFRARRLGQRRRC